MPQRGQAASGASRARRMAESIRMRRTVRFGIVFSHRWARRAGGKAVSFGDGPVPSATAGRAKAVRPERGLAWTVAPGPRPAYQKADPRRVAVFGEAPRSRAGDPLTSPSSGRPARTVPATGWRT